MSYARRPILSRWFFSSLIWSVFTLGAVGSTAFAIPWEEQAERLQKVSATLLDGVPLADPVTSPRSVEGRAVFSVLPKVNGKIGGKDEDVPAAPIHTVPTVQLSGLVLKSLGVQAWAGYLIPGAEKLLGLEAALSQWAAGASIGYYTAGSNSFRFFLPIGFQASQADLKGKIASAHGEDKFQSKSTLIYVAPGVIVSSWSVWSNVLVASKSTTSTFEIVEDQTTIELEDDLSESSLPVAVQVAAGWYHKSGLKVGVAELYVPERLAMPRIMTAYEYAF